MFHEGNLQSGIARAIQEQKLVGCFIQDGSAESTTWEDEWLKSGWLSSLLEQKAVLLRLQAGSTEAGFLAAFCSISETPTFIVIQNGQLQEQLSSGISQTDFVNRIRKVLGASPIPGTAEPAASTPVVSAPEATRTATPPQPSPPTRTPAAPTPPLSSVAKGKQKATAPATKPEPATSKAQQAAREALRKKKEEERAALERIKARIEADKAERKAQAEARKAEREKLTESGPTTSQFSATSSRGSNAKEVHLNVRMFDGATVRSSFPRSAKLQDDVRPWIDQEFVARAENPNERHPPYYFKQILAPLPSRELSAGDECQTLGDIDLAPSATLVLVPVKGYTDAYAGGSRGIVSGPAGSVFNIVGGAFNLAGSAVGYVSNTLSSVLGGGGSAPQDNQQQQEQTGEGRSLGNTPQEPPGSTGIRVRTLADQRSREPRNEQLYNGNQLNFEPRDEDSNR
ncbi:hypothetical protein DPSP01_005580 [Paraphaeosphaeria sporulosa]|uniref:UBX domain-containing protein n=1 Tax=Paraphaeosphaeria sporulosa TaxID=1460663 RepID=A0A177CUU8_9PLEO|nr:uncharacterized protein CC84DRAFT_1112923 [Paraphaeosphaeria sporulosa]OAG10529.1 hypothetical protein CC84DRAFT_1112923 [Paraphaeosphaeria sporulosa]